MTKHIKTKEHCPICNKALIKIKSNGYIEIIKGVQIISNNGIELKLKCECGQIIRINLRSK